MRSPPVVLSCTCNHEYAYAGAPWSALECDAIRPLHHFLYAYYLIVLRPAATAFRLSGLETPTAGRRRARVSDRHHGPRPRATRAVSRFRKCARRENHTLAGAADGLRSLVNSITFSCICAQTNREPPGRQPRLSTHHATSSGRHTRQYDTLAQRADGESRYIQQRIQHMRGARGARRVRTRNSLRQGARVVPRLAAAAHPAQRDTLRYAKRCAHGIETAHVSRDLHT